MNAFRRGFETLQRFSAFLLVGTILALAWANLAPASYLTFIEGRLIGPEALAAWEAAGGAHGIAATIYEKIAYWLAHDPATSAGLAEYAATHETQAPHTFNFHFIVNDLFMVLFFGIATKEVTESFLPGGALSSLSKASMPAIATLGGVLGPIATFFALHAILNPEPAITSAWAVPTATDIAYCWLFAQIVFGRSHPAVTFLLVLAVLDDLIGMLIIAVFYTSEVHPAWLGLAAAAMIYCEILRRVGVKSFWPYLLVGAPLSWFGLHNTGVHAALALVPVVPFMPHGGRDAGLFVVASKEKARVDEEEGRAEAAGHDPSGHDDHAGGHHGHHDDTLNRFEHFFKPIVDVGLFAFGLANAGVALNAGSFAGAATWVIFLALLLGKTVGIFLFSLIGTRLGLSLPKPMDLKQIVVLGCVAGIGFTVALFVTTVALQSGTAEQIASFAASGTGDMLKLGALLSFAAGPIALLIARAMRLRRIETPEQLARAVADAS